VVFCGRKWLILQCVAVRGYVSGTKSGTKGGMEMLGETTFCGLTARQLTDMQKENQELRNALFRIDSLVAPNPYGVRLVSPESAVTLIRQIQGIVDRALGDCPTEKQTAKHLAGVPEGR
jgi:hypothetical protein